MRNVNINKPKSFADRSSIASLSSKDKVKECLNAYRTFGVCKNIIDLMSDFASEGFEFVHENPEQQAFWKAWAKKTNLVERTERYANNLFKVGFVVIRSNKGKLTLSPPFVPKEITLANIPMEYIFLNPKQITLYGSKQEGGIYAVFSISQSYSNIPADIKKKLESNLSKDIKNAKRSGAQDVSLDPENTWIDCYKQDDWDTYPDSIVFSALPDLYFYDKMRSMDIATMDGVINIIRIWKLGVVQNGKYMKPTPDTVNKLREMLDQTMGGGVSDLIWDCNIDLQVEYPPVDKILGSEKYTFAKDEIFSVFGMPRMLVTGEGQASFANQVIGVKAVIERLEYAREKICAWISSEIAKVSDIIGWDTLPEIRFTYMNLRDENAIMKLLTGLFDRNLISKETLLSYFEELWPVERTKIIKEKMDANKNPELASINPYDNKQVSGGVTGELSDDNGRPNSINTKQSVSRDTKVQGT